MKAKKQNLRKILLILVIFLTISLVLGIFFWGEKLNREKINKVLATANSKLGSKFKPGAEGDGTFDSSGFVWWVFQKQNGIKLANERGAGQDYLNIGADIQKKNLKEGDLLFFRITPKSQKIHVGIYIGGNQFIHASKGYGKVLVNNLSDHLAEPGKEQAGKKTPTYNDIFFEARRIIGFRNIAKIETFEKGDEGIEVREFQKDLLSLGYKVPTNGVFEEKTEQMIKLVQKDYSLPKNGIVTPRVKELLKDL